MSEAKPTPGPWVVIFESDDGGQFAITTDDGRYVAQTAIGLFGEEQNANLIADAGTVHHKTGLTPSQLVARVNELEGVLQQMVDFFQPNAWGSDDNRKDALNDAIAVLAKTTEAK